MPLELTEIQPGAIAYFDEKILNNHADIIKPTQQPDRPGPFVCVQVSNNQSMWSNLTKAFRAERLEVIASWRIDGSKNWRTKNQYLSDGAATYTGPNSAFIDAASKESPFITIKRPKITDVGVVAIFNEINARNGNTI